MMYRTTSNPEYNDAFTSAKDIAETLYSEIAKYRADTSDLHSWQEWQMAMRMLGSKLLRPCAGFRLPPLEDV